MQSMLVPATPEELPEFEKLKPFTILNAGCFPCNRFTVGMSSATSVSVSFERGELVILGTQYAGEMKSLQWQGQCVQSTARAECLHCHDVPRALHAQP